jgi:hypothetical protein
MEGNEVKGTPKQISWARSIRKNRLAVWSRSEQFHKYESVIAAIDNAGWWISNQNQPFEAIYSKMKADAVALDDLQLWTRIDTPTGIRFISPTRKIMTGEVVAGDRTAPF